MPVTTGIPYEERIARLNDAFTALMSKTPFDTLGMKNFCDFARHIVIDSAPWPICSVELPNLSNIYYSYQTGSEYQTRWREYQQRVDAWKADKYDSDGGGNSGGYLNIKPIAYLRKNHSQIYQGLLPWLERIDD